MREPSHEIRRSRRGETRLLPREERRLRAGEQQVGPAMRVVCGVVSAAMLGWGVWGLLGGSSVGTMSGVLGFGAMFGIYAAFGLRRQRPFPTATPRFRELADAARPLPGAATDPASTSAVEIDT